MFWNQASQQKPSTWAVFPPWLTSCLILEDFPVTGTVFLDVGGALTLNKGSAYVSNNLLQRRLGLTYWTRTQHTGLRLLYYFVPTSVKYNLDLFHSCPLLYSCPPPLPPCIFLHAATYLFEPTVAIPSLFSPSAFPLHILRPPSLQSLNLLLYFLSSLTTIFHLPVPPPPFTHSPPASLRCDDRDAGTRRGECWVKQRRTTRPTQLPSEMSACVRPCMFVSVCVRMRRTKTDAENKAVRHDWKKDNHNSWMGFPTRAVNP